MRVTSDHNATFRSNGLEIAAISLKDEPELIGAYEQIGQEVWPKFMDAEPTSALIFENLHLVSATSGLFRDATEDFVGRFTATVFPSTLISHFESLPENGWDWLVNSTVSHALDTQLRQIGMPLTAGMLEIALLPKHQNRNLSRPCLQAVLALLSAHADVAIAPVRPNLKSHVPHEHFEEYCQRTNADGLAFDPWLRAHQRVGGEILNIANHSMIIPGTRSEWASWLNLTEDHISVNTCPDGGLVPLLASTSSDTFVYVEPNIWVKHDLRRHANC